eukprot:CAMPEP_0116131806 /NCGR_PEP_ID=MMETSP0329-20121206/9205_1 /TAXON_ID=697910 /ORGANISM="Pseudo-nitzschia arenysensis, Strain B593" /LENGTH=181 /DNA_ID=CAMNT_0003626267 /DNA_START=92 /DNA_END=637 /DNA_ORIENTATION=-
MATISLHSKKINLSPSEIMNLSIGDLGWDSTSDSEDEFDYDYHEYLKDSRSTHPEEEKDSNEFDGNFRWTDRTKISDEIPELIRRRKSVDQVDDADREESPDHNKCSTELGERILLLVNSPTFSPRSVLSEFLENQEVETTRPLKSSEEKGFIDDLSLDDTIYTTEDEMDYIRAVLEASEI